MVPWNISRYSISRWRVTGPSPAFLLGFDDSGGQSPIAGRDQRVDTARRCLARGIQQLDDAGIAGRQGSRFPNAAGVFLVKLLPPENGMPR